MDDAPEFDHLLKLLLVGDSGVGKSCLLLRFIDDVFEDVSPTIGVDFKLKHIVLNKKRLKLTVWDTAGQERFRTLTSSFYRGAQGVIFVYDITRRETFDNLSEVWLREVEMYSTLPDCVKMVVANKVDREAERVVTRSEGVAFARAHGCLFLEVSAKSRQGVQEAFAELVQRVVESPGLLAETGQRGVRLDAGRGGGASSLCSC